ncbi:hypothetical protein [Cryobacterium sp.]|uniref:hypothetical protein n=1 Tax=Cryobacterium sp. TaxID=1926290 RepID=UPI002605676C|nr:hypothetical protein [Cryobacterium sp.]
MTGATGTAITLALQGVSATPAQAATAAKLPYEVSRTANVTTGSAGRKLYDNILVNIKGDLARIFLPQAVVRGQKTAVGAVWFFHGGGSSQDALNGGFKYPAELVVDKGAIAICINAGGNQYTNDQAKTAQVNAWNYLSALFPVRMNFLRATSAGGALACYTYARKLIPYIKGLYMVNALYDLEGTSSVIQAQASVEGAFGNNPAQLVANNPARFPASDWTGANVKALVSDAEHLDAVVPPTRNGIALVNKITPVAADARLAFHTLGHDTPSFAHKDMMVTFGAWSGVLR